MRHELKCDPGPFEAVMMGYKPFEFRKNDRGFDVGDILVLKEWKNMQYTGRSVERVVTYALRPGSYGADYGVPFGYVVMGLRPVEPLSAYPLTVEIVALALRDELGRLREEYDNLSLSRAEDLKALGAAREESSTRLKGLLAALGGLESLTWEQAIERVDEICERIDNLGLARAEDLDALKRIHADRLQELNVALEQSGLGWPEVTATVTRIREESSKHLAELNKAVDQANRLREEAHRANQACRERLVELHDVLGLPGLGWPGVKAEVTRLREESAARLEEMKEALIELNLVLGTRDLNWKEALKEVKNTVEHTEVLRGAHEDRLQQLNNVLRQSGLGWPEVLQEVSRVRDRADSYEQTAADQLADLNAALGQVLNWGVAIEEVKRARQSSGRHWLTTLAVKINVAVPSQATELQIFDAIVKYVETLIFVIRGKTSARLQNLEADLSGQLKEQDTPSAGVRFFKPGEAVNKLLEFEAQAEELVRKFQDIRFLKLEEAVNKLTERLDRVCPDTALDLPTRLFTHLTHVLFRSTSLENARNLVDQSLVKDFQKAEGILADGLYGRDTRERLKGKLGEAPPALY